jgi:23S rRNA pseudouridine1911/1915/1917 synthase
MAAARTLKLVIPETLAGQRLDQALAALVSDYSRSRLQQWIQAGQVQVDGKFPRTRDRVAGGEEVTIGIQEAPQQDVGPEDIALDVRYADEALLVINKPPGLVVHPAAGNRDGTLQNALLFYDPALAALPRAGIVHRLDRDTGGLLVVARTLPVHHYLVREMQARRIEREYDAIVNGVMTGGGTVDAPIGRHAVDRKRMAVTRRGKPAVTHYRIVERFPAHTHIRVRLETGRTHQIRVHMAHVHHALIGDPVYGGRMKLPPGLDNASRDVFRSFRRQALHASSLGLIHPVSGEPMSWASPLPDDMVRLLALLRGTLTSEA